MDATSSTDRGAALAREVESGHVFVFSRTEVSIREHEEKFLDPSGSNGSAKIFSLDKDEGSIKGAAGTSKN